MNKKLIIIGAGLAGMAAALTAAKKNYVVYLVSSQPSEQSQSVMAEGGINGALNTKGEADSPQEHYNDTMHAGCELADPNAVWQMTQAAPSLITQLAAMGVPFNRIGSSYDIDLRNFGGQKKKRTAFVQSDTGKQLVTALIDALRREEVHGLVQRFSHHDFVTLCHDHTVCGGCLIQDTYTGRQTTLLGDAVIIATGGMHGLFQHTTGSLANTGAVTAELFRLGLPLANGEFIQYHPTTVMSNGKRMLLSEAARGEGGRLYTLRQGQPYYFMEEKYPELGNLMPRDITSREIEAMIEQYGTVYLDMRHLSPAVWEHKLQGLQDDCQTYLGLSARTSPIPVAPGIHYFMGGLYVDAAHRTPWQNLYAAGECAAQYHGANRLGGNSLLGAIYGGITAAQTACTEGTGSACSASCHVTPVPPAPSLHEWQMLRHVLSQALGLRRSYASLWHGLKQIHELQSPPALLGKALLYSALARKESRGAHWRSDYPARNDAAYKKTTVASYNSSTIQIQFMPIPKKK